MRRSFDVVLIGGGVVGLMSAAKLSELGLSVLLVEANGRLAEGPSTRNEGWLHRGTYHAQSIGDRALAIEVARRCIYGHEQIRALAPEAVESGGPPNFALVRDSDRVDEVRSRWRDAGVRFRPIDRSRIEAAAPEADLSRVAAAFEVDDASVDTRLLYRKLLARARANGCMIRTRTVPTEVRGSAVTLRGPEGVEVVEARLVVYACGPSVSSLFEQLHGVKLPMRFWKSHLVVTRRLSRVGLFYLDAGEAAMMHHGAVSIIGLNEDAVRCEAAGTEVLPPSSRALRAAIARLIPGWSDPHAIDVACTKVDVPASVDDARSLSVAMGEPAPGHVYVLPGKMTEAPYISDRLTAFVHERLEDPLISFRPCDGYAGTNEAALA